MRNISLVRKEKMVIASLREEHNVLSWALCGGGMVAASDVVWAYVQNSDLPLGLDPVALLQQRLNEAGLPRAVGMMTSRELKHLHTASADVDGVLAEAVATAGLSNALRVGDPPGLGSVGTINLLVRLSCPLSPSAMIEAVSLAAEARTTAMIDAQWSSCRSGLVATGTGTDCIVIASPRGGTPETWCGKHTAAGSAMGQASFEVIHEAVAAWITEKHSS